MAIQDIFQAILAFDEAKVKDLTRAEINAGSDIDSILNDGMIAAMDDVGKKFSEGILFVPEMLMAAQAMKGGLEILKPHLSGDSAASRGKVIIGTVKGDLHDIGKNLVSMMMANIIAAEALAGRDNFCMNYLKAFRAENFEF